MFKAGFAQADITPPLGTHKIGWLRDLVPTRILDPLYAKVAVFESDGERIAIVALDTLLSERKTVVEVRRRAAALGIPGMRLMMCATHNHAGPAVGRCGDVPEDGPYVARMRDSVLDAIGRAVRGLEPAEWGVASVFEHAMTHSRRVVQRDGTVKTHGRFTDPAEALCFEGPVDPEVAVVAARRPGGALLGILVCYANHPTHHGGDDAFSAGYPGALAARMAERGCPVTLYLTGAQGSIHFGDPRVEGEPDEAAVGGALADDAVRALAAVRWRPGAVLDAASETVVLPFRTPTPEEIAGKVPGAQRFIDPAIYERGMPALLDEVRRFPGREAEAQCLFLDELAFVSLPGEFFGALGLSLKERAFPRRAIPVGLANGDVGYVPHREAFARGGYETTFGLDTSVLAPGAGELFVETAAALIARRAKAR